MPAVVTVCRCKEGCVGVGVCVVVVGTCVRLNRCPASTCSPCYAMAYGKGDHNSLMQPRVLRLKVLFCSAGIST